MGDHSPTSTCIRFQAALMLTRGDSLDSVVQPMDEAESYTAPDDALSVPYLAVLLAQKE